MIIQNDGAGSADPDREGDAGDVAEADGRGERRGERLEMTDLAGLVGLPNSGRARSRCRVGIREG